MKIKYIVYCLLLVGGTSHAGLNISTYKNCTGIPLKALNIKPDSNFSISDSYTKYGYDYSTILDISNKESVECLIVNNNRKVILDIVPSMVNDSCSGQWDPNSKSPIWMSDIGGGKDGVNYLNYLSSDRLRKLNHKDTVDLNEIIENINCQMSTYTKFDAKELNDSAYFLYKLNRLSDSLKILNKVIELDPNRTVAYLNLADVHLGLKNEVQARKNYLIYSSKMEKLGLSKKIPNRIKKYL